MTRTGKIARLPKSIRDEVNRRLEDNQEAKQITAWLNSVPAVVKILNDAFNGEDINEVNISNWKSGGFLDWQRQRNALASIRLAKNQAADVERETGDTLTDIIAMKAAAETLLEIDVVQQEQPEGEEKSKALDRLYGRLIQIRRGDHNARRIEIAADMVSIDREKFEMARKEKEAAKNAHKKKRGGISEAVLREIEEKANLL